VRSRDLNSELLNTKQELLPLRCDSGLQLTLAASSSYKHCNVSYTQYEDFCPRYSVISVWKLWTGMDQIPKAIVIHTKQSKFNHAIQNLTHFDSYIFIPRFVKGMVVRLNHRSFWDCSDLWEEEQTRRSVSTKITEVCGCVEACLHLHFVFHIRLRLDVWCGRKWAMHSFPEEARFLISTLHVI
jgi:hypothetical protein